MPYSSSCSLTLLCTHGRNPSGVSVLSVLKNGSDNGVDEAKGYTLPGIHWFAAKWNALQNMRQAHFQPLSSRDRRRIETLNSSGKVSFTCPRAGFVSKPLTPRCLTTNGIERGSRPAE